MKIRLLVVGHLKETYWKEAQNEYLKRLTPYAQVDIEEVDDHDYLTALVKATCSELPDPKPKNKTKKK